MQVGDRVQIFEPGVYFNRKGKIHRISTLPNKQQYYFIILESTQQEDTTVHLWLEDRDIGKITKE